MISPSDASTNGTLSCGRVPGPPLQEFADTFGKKQFFYLWETVSCLVPKRLRPVLPNSSSFRFVVDVDY